MSIKLDFDKIEKGLVTVLNENNNSIEKIINEMKRIGPNKMIGLSFRIQELANPQNFVNAFKKIHADARPLLYVALHTLGLFPQGGQLTTYKNMSDWDNDYNHLIKLLPANTPSNPTDGKLTDHNITAKASSTSTSGLKKELEESQIKIKTAYMKQKEALLPAGQTKGCKEIEAEQEKECSDFKTISFKEVEDDFIEMLENDPSIIQRVCTVIKTLPNIDPKVEKIIKNVYQNDVSYFIREIKYCKSIFLPLFYRALQFLEAYPTGWTSYAEMEYFPQNISSNSLAGRVAAHNSSVNNNSLMEPQNASLQRSQAAQQAVPVEPKKTILQKLKDAMNKLDEQLYCSIRIDTVNGATIVDSGHSFDTDKLNALLDKNENMQNPLTTGPIKHAFPNLMLNDILPSIFKMRMAISSSQNTPTPESLKDLNIRLQYRLDKIDSKLIDPITKQKIEGIPMVNLGSRQTIGSATLKDRNLTGEFVENRMLKDVMDALEEIRPLVQQLVEPEPVNDQDKNIKKIASLNLEITELKKELQARNTTSLQQISEKEKLQTEKNELTQQLQAIKIEKEKLNEVQKKTEEAYNELKTENSELKEKNNKLKQILKEEKENSTYFWKQCEEYKQAYEKLTQEKEPTRTTTSTNRSVSNNNSTTVTYNKPTLQPGKVSFASVRGQIEQMLDISPRLINDIINKWNAKRLDPELRNTFRGNSEAFVEFMIQKKLLVSFFEVLDEMYLRSVDYASIDTTGHQ